MPSPTESNLSTQVEIPDDFQQTLRLLCDITGSKKPETVLISRTGIDAYVDGKEHSLYRVPSVEEFKVTSVVCEESLTKSKKHNLDVEILVSTLSSDVDPVGVGASFLITGTDIKEKLVQAKQNEKEFKSTQKLKDVRKALKKMKSGESVYSLVEAIKMKQGAFRVKALEMAKKEILLAFNEGEDPVKKLYLIQSIFMDGFLDVGDMPSWSYGPIYQVFADKNLHDKAKEDPLIYDLLEASSLTLGGAHSQMELDQIKFLLMDDAIDPGLKEGLVVSLGQTGLIESADIIIQYAKEQKLVGVAMRVIPDVLINDLDARAHYWNLQIHYAEQLASEARSDENYLGSYFHESDFKRLETFTENDLAAVDEILRLLAIREESFKSEWHELEIKFNKQDMKRWQGIRDLIKGRLLAASHL